MTHPLLQRLKQETRNEHEQLEARLDLLRPGMTLAEYRGVLENFYGFYFPWERSAMPLLNRSLPHFFEERRKTFLLEKDLLFLGSDVAALPQCQHLPSAASLISLLGSLYVLEGATLGGQILARHFTQHFNFLGKEGCSFFSSYGAAVATQWRAFCNLLALYSSPTNDAIIVKSALDTFIRFSAWLSRPIGGAISQKSAGTLSTRQVR